MQSDQYERYQEWKGWEEKSFGICSHELAVYYSDELQSSGIADVNGMTILEIGFGNGAFASWAKTAGADYHGTEIIEQLVTHGANAGFNTHDGRLPLDKLLGEQSLDLIVSFDVFEHLDAETLRTTLLAAYRALRPLGRLIARVPSGDSPFSRAIQHGDATHCTIIGSSMVNQLAQDAGFEVLEVRQPVFPVWGLGLKVFLRRIIVTTARKLAFPLITQLFMGGGRPVLTPNLVFVLLKP